MADRDITLALKAKDETGGAVASAGMNLDELKKKMKGFNDTAELLKGGGALIGLMSIGAAAVSVTNEIKRLGEEANKLDLKGAERFSFVLDGLAAKIPLIGQFYTVGKNINELLGGAAAEAKKIADSTDLIVTRFASMQAGAVAFRNSIKEVDDYIAGIQQKLQLIGKGPEITQQLSAQFGANDSIDQLDKKYEEARQRIYGATQPGTTALQEQIKAQIKTVDELQSRLDLIKRTTVSVNHAELPQEPELNKAQDELRALQEQLSEKNRTQLSSLVVLKAQYDEAKRLTQKKADEEIAAARDAEKKKLREMTAARDAETKAVQLAIKNQIEEQKRLDREKLEAGIKAAQEQARAEAEARRKVLEDNNNIGVDIAAKQLRAMGKEQDAALLEMRNRANQEIADIQAQINALPRDGTDAQKTADLQKRIELINQRTNQDAADLIRKNQAAEAAPAFNGAVVRRFGSASGSGGVLAASPQIKIATDALTEQKKATKLLEKIAEKVGAGSPVTITPGEIGGI